MGVRIESVKALFGSLPSSMTFILNYGLHRETALFK